MKIESSDKIFFFPFASAAYNMIIRKKSLLSHKNERSKKKKKKKTKKLKQNKSKSKTKKENFITVNVQIGQKIANSNQTVEMIEIDGGEDSMLHTH